MVTDTTIKKGYKQTELGVIPEDWEVKSLGDVLKVRHGKSQKEVINSNGIYPILASGGEIGRSNKYLYNKPSVLIGRKGTIDKPQYKETPFWTVDTLFFTEINENHNAKFIFYKFNSINWYDYNEASGVPSLNASTIERIKQTFPSKQEEQTSIATVLSDTDTLIEHLEKLIAKKKAIKQGTMQQLLTGKKRLPGFSGEWEIKRLDVLFNISSGGGKVIPERTQGKYFIVEMGSIAENGKLLTNKKTNCDINFLISGDLVMPTRDIGEGKIIGKVAMIDNSNNYVLGNNVYRLTVKDNLIDARFFYYLINSQPINNALKKKVAKSVQLALNKAYVEAQEVSFPPKKTEQTAIATILSDMDAEIESLEKKRDKYTMLKQGMMQQLLTGRIRIYANN